MNRSGRLDRLIRTHCFGLVLLATGVVSNHLSCSRIVQDSVAEGAGAFLSGTTADLLTLLFWPERLGAYGGDDGGSGNGDPFEPPVQS